MSRPKPSDGAAGREREDRFYRLLLAVYSPPLRRMMASEMLSAFQNARRGRSPGLFPWLRFWIWILSDWAVSAAADHLKLHFSAVRPEAASPRRKPMLESFFKDLSHACRRIRSSPGITALVLFSLTLGIGANSVVFSLVNALLIRPLPVREPASLVRIGGRQEQEFSVVSYQEYRRVAEDVPAFSGVLAFTFNAAAFNLDAEPREVAAEAVSSNYFELLGVAPSKGRDFDQRAEAAEAIISHRFWQRSMDGRPDVLGLAVKVNAHPYTIVGVARPGFHGAFPGFECDLWLPLLRMSEIFPRGGSLEEEGDRFLHLIGRLQEGVPLDLAQAQLDTLAARLEAADPSWPEQRRFALVSVQGVHPRLAGVARLAAGFLMAITGLVLLIACANVAGLLLARSLDRTHEIAVRQSLGASRWRLLRLLLAESVVLASLGGALGLSLAWAANQILLSLLRPTAGLPVGLGVDLGIDWRILAFTAAISVMTGLLCGLVPAWRAGEDLTPWLKAGAGSISGSRSRLRSGLVILQVAVTALLMVGAVLVGRSVLNSRLEDAGLPFQGVLLVQPETGSMGYDRLRLQTLWEDLTRRLRSQAEVEQVALALFVPLGSRSDQHLLATPESDSSATRRRVDYNLSGPGYFRLMGITILQGRGFEERDQMGSPAVAIINQTLSTQLWPHGTALGRRLKVWERRGDPRLVEVVGVAQDIRYRSLSEPPTPYVYYPWSQWNREDLSLHLRVHGAAPGLRLRLLEEVRHVDPELPVSIRSLEEEMSYALAITRITGGFLGFGGIVGLSLALVGIFGMVSYNVSQRTREFGIRLALGASGLQVVRRVAQRSLGLILVGISLGLIPAVWGARLIQGVLYGVSPLDPISYGLVAAALLVTGSLAVWLPARRACGLNPVRVLRED